MEMMKIRAGGLVPGVALGNGMMLMKATVAATALGLGAPGYSQVIEEIVVTARKREESLQDVSVAVTAMPAERIESLGVRRLDELNAMAPNLRILESSTGPSVATLHIRGIGYNGTEKLDAPSVGVFIDDFYWGMGHGQLVDTFDVEMIEILRGPQSVLFGKNTSGGAVVIRRNQPKGETSINARLGLGNYDSNLVQVVAHTPSVLDGAVAAKIGYTRKDRDGYSDNLYDGSDEGENTYEAIHGMLSWDFTERLSALLIFDDIEERGEATPLQNSNPLGAQIFFGGQPLVPGADHWEVWPDQQSDMKLDAQRYSLRLDWELPFGTITSITGYLDEEDITLQDFDSGCAGDTRGLGCPFPPNPLLVSASNPTGTLHTIRDQGFEEFTQELRVDATLHETLTLQAGGYYYEDEIFSRQTTNFQAFESTAQDTTSYAAFGRLTWAVTPDVSVYGGLQWIEDEKEFAKTVSLVPELGGTVLLPLVTDEREWDETVYQAGVQWFIEENHMVYASLSDGFRSGGFSARGTGVEAVDPSQPNFTGDGSNFLSFEPETTRSYELGSKSTLFGGIMQLNLAAYWTELEGLQQGTVVLTPGFPINTNTITNNFQEVTYKGFEVESVLSVPGVEGLTLIGNAGYLDAEVEEAVVPAVRLGVGPGGVAGSPAQGLVDLAEGAVLGQAPEYTYALGAFYERSVGGRGAVEAALQWSYTDDVVLSSVGSAAHVQDGYGLLNGSIAYRWGDWKVQLIGNNLTDEEYFTTSLPNVLFVGFGNPRTYQVEVTYAFGAD